jgi:hypothetical protein
VWLGEREEHSRYDLSIRKEFFSTASPVEKDLTQASSKERDETGV